jgi:tetratricopeptide (TPR) repeat protein
VSREKPYRRCPSCKRDNKDPAVFTKVSTKAGRLTITKSFARLPPVSQPGKSGKRKAGRIGSADRRPKLLKKKVLASKSGKSSPPRILVDPAVEEQLKHFEEALQHFQEQKYAKAKPLFEKALAGPSREFADRARVHLRIVEQRMRPTEAPTPRSPEEHYQHGVAMMNMGRWDEAREHLLRARKLAPKADYVIYAMAALDCLTGEADSAMENLKLAIQLRPENRYHARNDEDFAFLQEDPRFTELLYPDRDGSSS